LKQACYHDPGASQKAVKSVRARIAKFSDLELLSRLRDLSSLSNSQLKNVHDAMSTTNVSARVIAFEERQERNLDTQILLSGSLELSYVSGQRSRIIAILSPGVIFRMPSLTAEIGYGFRWTALEDGRIARL
jgi:hypothetical protein